MELGISDGSKFWLWKIVFFPSKKREQNRSRFSNWGAVAGREKETVSLDKFVLKPAFQMHFKSFVSQLLDWI